MQWRRENDIDNLDQWEMPEVLRKYIPGGHVGYDKQGAPVFVTLETQLDWKGTLYSGRRSTWLLHLFAHNSRLVFFRPSFSFLVKGFGGYDCLCSNSGKKMFGTQVTMRHLYSRATADCTTNPA